MIAIKFWDCESQLIAILVNCAAPLNVEHEKRNEQGGRSHISVNKCESKWDDRHKKGRTNKESKENSIPIAISLDLYNVEAI